jgi:DNA-binding SARP family transcriptional activator/tetratricopeptide (TPR) repeat protein
VEFKVLGPLEVAAGTERLKLQGSRQQIVVATLLLNANEVVPVYRLLEAIYGEDLPSTARSQAQISISSLRRLFASHGRDTVITTHAHGYAIAVGDGQLDYRRFEGLVTAARAAHESGRPDLAVARYRDALRLWRGPALDDIDSQFIRAAASRLDELRISSNEDRIALELDLGRHHELVGELVELIERYPLREHLRGQLMLALYRCDRAAEALEVYRVARRTMIEELGIEPSERLQRLEHAVLASDSRLDPPSSSAATQLVRRQVPNLLPADIGDFTSREEEVSQIAHHLVHSGKETRLAVPVVVVVGKGGVGKTTLAVHVAHGVADHFPDGQLFADLHSASHPVSPTQVLERFIRAFGTPGVQVPEGLEERAEMYRNLLGDRRVLVVLDGAASENQVLPLLPGSGAAGVIVSSRSPLAGLAGSLRITVDVFEPRHSVELLGRIAGAERLRAQSEEAAAVAEHCGHLPLALRIAGARLAARPHWTIQQLVDRLGDETRRLDELRYGEMGIRPSISLIYESASEQARKLFRRLALLDMPVFSGWLGAPLLDQPIAIAEDLLDELVNAQLIELTGTGLGVDSQYRFHDLIRVFARERLAAEESAAGRRAALERALTALLYLANEASRLYHGSDYVRISSDAPQRTLPERLVKQLIRNPLLWYERERSMLVSGVRQAARSGFAELCWSLAFSAIALFESRVYLDDWRETHEIALEAARKAGNVCGQAMMLYSGGSLNIALRRFGQARQELTAAVQLFQEAGEEQGTALALRNIASVDRLSGRLSDATERCEQALAIFTKIGDQVGAAWVLQDMAQIELERNRPARARELLSEALRRCRAAGSERHEAQVLVRLGEASLLSGELAGAVEAFELALTLVRAIGDLIGEAYALQGYGVAKVRQREFSQALSALHRALELAQSIGERLAEARALLGLSELAIGSGDPGPAVAHAQGAAEVCREVGAALDEVRALSSLSEAYRALGDVDAAEAAATEATVLRAKLIGDEPLRREHAIAYLMMWREPANPIVSQHIKTYKGPPSVPYSSAKACR